MANIESVRDWRDWEPEFGPSDPVKPREPGAPTIQDALDQGLNNREYTVKKAGDAAKGLVIFGTVTAVLYLALTEFPGWIAGR